MSDRERQIPYAVTYMWNLKNKTNLVTITTITTTTTKPAYRYREQTSGYQQGEGRAEER